MLASTPTSRPETSGTGSAGSGGRQSQSQSRSFEITPVEDGQHVGFAISDLAGAEEQAIRSCGVQDTDHGADHGTGHGTPGAALPAPTAVTAAPGAGSMGNAGAMDGGGRERRSCTKVVEVLILNDHSLFTREGETTETTSLDIFNSMASLYARSGFACTMQV